MRQVATLVARESSPDQLFAVVAEQVARIFDVPHVRLVRYEPDGSVVVGGFSEGDDEPFPIGSRWPLDSPGVTATVRQTGRPARVEDYAHLTGEVAAVARGAGMRSAVASPIVVEGRLWGAMVVLSPRHEPFPEDTEARLTDFTELVATAIANAESREARARLAEEQAALRRVATLVAQGVSPQDLFEAVAEEVGRLLPVGSATMGRFEPDGSVTTVASWSTTEAAFPTGSAVADRGHERRRGWCSRRAGPLVSTTSRAATDPIGVAAREAGIKSAVGSPIVVEGHLWGVMTATSTEGPLPPDTEARLASFTELVATAIANAESSAELAASRRRIVAASDDARRRIERNLHDGTQQRLVSLGLELRAAEANLPPERDDLRAQLVRRRDGIGGGGRGSAGDLAWDPPGDPLQGRARSSVAGARSPVRDPGRPRDHDRRATRGADRGCGLLRRLGGSRQRGEAFAGVAHRRLARAARRRLWLRFAMTASAERIRARLGLVGLTDRVEALGGSIRVASRPGEGTQITAELPLALETAVDHERASA